MPRVSQLLRDTPLRLRLRYALSLPKAAAYWQEQCRQTCDRPGTPNNRSRPGEAPRRQSGVGVESIKARVELHTLSIVTTANVYMAALNAGASRDWQGGPIAPRPWVEITRRRVGAQVKRLAFGKGNA
jgi:hypothetical protein